MNTALAIRCDDGYHDNLTMSVRVSWQAILAHSREAVQRGDVTYDGYGNNGWSIFAVIQSHQHQSLLHKRVLLSLSAASLEKVIAVQFNPSAHVRRLPQTLRAVQQAASYLMGAAMPEPELLRALDNEAMFACMRVFIAARYC